MRTLRTTEEGRAFLQAYGQIDHMLKKQQSWAEDEKYEKN
jgi:hypothetical protein